MVYSEIGWNAEWEGLWRRCMMGREADFPKAKKDLGHHVEGLGLHSKYYMELLVWFRHK